MRDNELVQDHEMEIVRETAANAKRVMVEADAVGRLCQGC